MCNIFAICVEFEILTTCTTRARYIRTQCQVQSKRKAALVTPATRSTKGRDSWEITGPRPPCRAASFFFQIVSLTLLPKLIFFRGRRANRSKRSSNIITRFTCYQWRSRDTVFGWDSFLFPPPSPQVCDRLAPCLRYGATYLITISLWSLNTSWSSLYKWGKPSPSCLATPLLQVLLNQHRKIQRNRTLTLISER